MDTILDPPPASPDPEADHEADHEVDADAEADADAESERTRPSSRPRLARNTSARVLGGVAAGIADHFEISPLLVRLAFVVAAFFGGIGVIVYVVAWIVLPSSTPGVPPAPRDNRQLLGFGLVALGLATIPNGVGFGWSLNGAFWPLALVTLGGTVLWLRTRDDRDEPPDPPPAATTPRATIAASPASPAAPAPAEVVAAPAPPRPQRARRDKPPRGPVTALTLSALLIVGGVTWLVVIAGSSTVDFGIVAALALTIVGAGVVVSAWIGRARGLVVLGVVLALVVGAFGAIDVPLRGGVGEATYAPATHGAVHRRYQMAIGRLELDFARGVLAGRSTEVTATVGIGHLVVRVPHDVRLVVHGHAGVGTVSILGRDEGNCCPSDMHVMRAGAPGRGTLVLHARVGTGAIDITRVPTVPAPPGVPSIPSVPSTEVSNAAT